MARPRLLPDNFTLALLGAVAIATLLPARGQGVAVFEWITNLAIGLLFFMHGAKLSGPAILAGLGHWRLHLLVFGCTFVLFPLLGLVLACCLLLALALGITWLIARGLGFDLEDRITILFAGSKKSLATGIPMAQVLFAGGALGTLILPLMLFHQIQLMVCAVLAQRYAARPESAPVAKAV